MSKHWPFADPQDVAVATLARIMRGTPVNVVWKETRTVCSPISRRVFLKTCSVSGALRRARRAGCRRTQPATAPSWVDRPMRWAQLTLVEDDPGKFDPDFWLDYFRRTHSDARLPQRRRLRRLLSDRGPVPPPQPVAGRPRPVRRAGRGLPQARHGRASRGPTRTRPTTTSSEAHPDWIAVDAEGRPRRHWASPEMWVTCALGPYNFEFMTAVHREIMTRYRVDGIFINRWSGSGMCFCEHCREQLPGRDRPRTAAHGRSAGSGAPGLHPLAAAAPLRALAALGRRGPQDQPRLLRHPQHRRRRHQPARHEDHRRAGPDALRRPPGAQRR